VPRWRNEISLEFSATNTDQETGCSDDTVAQIKLTEVWSLIGKTTWHHAIKRGSHGIYGNVMETDCVG
jgi:hypothetical protein